MLLLAYVSMKLFSHFIFFHFRFFHICHCNGMQKKILIHLPRGFQLQSCENTNNVSFFITLHSLGASTSVHVYFFLCRVDSLSFEHCLPHNIFFRKKNRIFLTYSINLFNIKISFRYSKSYSKTILKTFPLTS